MTSTISSSEMAAATNLDFLDDSEMGRRTRSYDWSRTSLGPISAWPQSLKTTDRTTQVVEALLAGEAEALTRKAVALALEGGYDRPASVSGAPCLTAQGPSCDVRAATAGDPLPMPRKPPLPSWSGWRQGTYNEPGGSKTSSPSGTERRLAAWNYHSRDR